MWIDRSLPLVLALVLAGCATPPAHPTNPTHGTTQLVLGVETMTQTRQRVQLEVDDDDASTPPVTARADLPAYSTSRDFVGRLRVILEQKGVAATSGESPIPEHAPRDNEALTLPDGYRVAALTIRKKDGDEWVPSGPADLVRVDVP